MQMYYLMNKDSHNKLPFVLIKEVVNKFTCIFLRSLLWSMQFKIIQRMRINSEVKYLAFASTFSSLFTGRFLATFRSFSFQELIWRIFSRILIALRLHIKKHTDKRDHIFLATRFGRCMDVTQRINLIPGPDHLTARHWERELKITLRN